MDHTWGALALFALSLGLGAVHTAASELPVSGYGRSLQATVPCPAAGSSSASVSIDPTAAASFFADSSPTFVNASSAADCLRRAQASFCAEGTRFYVYHAPGLLVPGDPEAGSTILGTCAFGAACSSIAPGSGLATVGQVPPAPCANTTVPCPSGLGLKVVSLDLSGPLTNLIPDWTRWTVEDLESCRQLAISEQCGQDVGNNLGGFFAFLPDDTVPGSRNRNCIWGSSCGKLTIGPTSAIVGNIALQSCPPYPPYPPSPPNLPPPPPPPVPRPSACPTAAQGIQVVSIDPIALSSILVPSPSLNITFAKSAAECEAAAREADCMADFFLYSLYTIYADYTYTGTNCFYGRCRGIFAGSLPVAVKAIRPSC